MFRKLADRYSSTLSKYSTEAGTSVILPVLAVEVAASSRRFGGYNEGTGRDSPLGRRRTANGGS